MGNKKTNLEETIRKNALLLIFAAMCLVFAIFSPTFRTLTNWMNVLRQVSINGILAVGMTMIICSAGIDLSIGPLCAMSGVVSALILEKSPDFPVLLAMLIGILASGVMSMWTAFLVANMRIAPFIATLSTMSVAKGVGLVIADGMPHTIAHPLYTALGSGFVWDPKLTGNVSLPQPVLVFAIVVAVMCVVMYRTKFGKYIYASGGNENAAIAAGIHVVKVKFFAYVLNGIICGIAGIVLAGRITSGNPTAATGYETDAITATIIGGTSMTGGVGTIQGTIIGVLIIGVLNNGLVLFKVSSYYQTIIKGLIIAIAVLLDMKTKGNRS